jgi:hypothetical protein
VLAAYMQLYLSADSYEQALLLLISGGEVKIPTTFLKISLMQVLFV